MNLEPGTKFKVIDSNDGTLEVGDILTLFGIFYEDFMFSGTLSTTVHRLPEDIVYRCLEEIPVDVYKDLLQSDLSLTNMINHAMHVFPKAFINRSDEFILVPKHNVYFGLRGMKTALDFKMKMFAWLSRPISKGLKRKPAHKLLDRFNILLNTQFTMEDMSRIYTKLGHGCNRELCIRFIESGYDMKLLQYESEASS